MLQLLLSFLYGPCCIPIHHIEKLDQSWAQVALDKGSSILDRKKLCFFCITALLIMCRLQRSAPSLPSCDHGICWCDDWALYPSFIIRIIRTIVLEKKAKRWYFPPLSLDYFLWWLVCWFSTPTGNLSVSDTRSYCLLFVRIDLIQLKSDLDLVLSLCAFDLATLDWYNFLLERALTVSLSNG